MQGFSEGRKQDTDRGIPSSTAACLTELYEDGDPDAKLEEVDKLMKEIPTLTKKIAGKSLPIEVCLLISHRKTLVWVSIGRGGKESC